MRYILVPVGSTGDVHPFLGIGRELRTRGHDVTLAAGEPFRAPAQRAGLDFLPTWTEEAFELLAQDPGLWHPKRGLQVVLGAVSNMLSTTYAALHEAYRPGETTLVGHTLALPVRLLEEKYGAPAATIHLAPGTIRSTHLAPALPPVRDISGAPGWFKRALFWAIDRWYIDPYVAGPLNALRSDLGLPPVSRVFESWIHSPNATIGLFPEWFGPPQPDWPKSMRLTAFPLYDDDDGAPDPELDGFLAAGDPPIVFTPGSANRQAPAFFEAALDATTVLGRRALFLTRYPEQLPVDLPDTVRHVPWVPLARLLPDCAAIVHHGGIGTCAQGLAAGIPQLTMPMGFDQPDNSLRLQRLGVGAYLEPHRFKGKLLASAVSRLLNGRTVAAACVKYSDETRSEDGVGLTCDALERL
jgi:UDP:flavonoid glycosyltransferase YjiC (YdhE family)